MAEPSIVTVSPANNSTGVYLKAPIEVIFDQEIDPTSVVIVLEGPDGDRWSGPDMSYWEDPNEDPNTSILTSPGYKGILAGTFTFSKIDTDGNEVSTYDYSGQGSLWRTKVTYTPDYPFGPLVNYKVYLYGDEEDGDALEVGVSARTVFDAVKGANLGDGDAFFYGGYTGTISDKFIVQMIETGESGQVRFQWYKESDPSIVRQMESSRKRQLLTDGVYVYFRGDHQIGDTFSSVVKPAERLQTSYYWSFTTGSGNIQVVPDTAGSTGIGLSSSLTDAGFEVVEITPENRTTNLVPTTVQTITVKFNKKIDVSTITDESVRIWSEPVNGIYDGNNIDYSGDISKTLTVSDDGYTLIIQIS
jgi:hypothetical protein